MDIDGNGGMAGLVEAYRRQLAELDVTQRRLAEISCTATSRRRVVSVTVGHGGVVRALTFDGSGYTRMAPAELSSTVLAVVEEAQQQAAAEAAEILAPSMPPELVVTADQVRAGRGDLRQLVPLRPVVADAVSDNGTGAGAGG
ncbi:MAG: YbaB/EbfC family nucleoid-associated protein [Dermatophilaceae bacterium]